MPVTKYHGVTGKFHDAAKPRRAQQFVAKWIREKRKGKVVFTSSMGGLFTPDGYGIYVSTKHALEAIAEAMSSELKKYNIKYKRFVNVVAGDGLSELSSDLQPVPMAPFFHRD